MKEKKCYSIIKQVKAIILIIAIILTNLPYIDVQAATTSTQYVEDIDFSDFSNWRSGVYFFTTGKYVANNQRLCLKDYVKFNSTKYKVHISNSEYKLLIRELDCNKNYITSYQLANGQVYKPGAKAVYLAIGIYRYAGEYGINYSTYKSLFNKGFVAELVSTDIGQTVTGGSSSSDEYESAGSEESKDKVVYESVEDVEFSVFSNWKTGQYSMTTGKYNSHGNRICLNDYVTFEGTKYRISITNTAYHMLIRELDKNFSFIKSYNLANGATYTPSSKAVYLGVSLYNYSSESGINYTTYKNLFANGFTAKLVDYSSTSSDSIIIETPIFGSSGSSSSSTNSSTSGSVSDDKTGSTAVYNILKNMIQNADSSEKSILSYKVTYSEFYNTICPRLAEDLYLEYHTYYNLSPSGSISGSYMSTCKLENVDSDARARLARVRESVDTFLASVDSRMSDVEKVLLAHEYVVTNTLYKDDGTISHKAGGPLGNGYGVCDGYADAMRVLLHEVGIETDMLRSKTMNHAWLYVKLDGSWYHIDATWDDTRKGTNNRYMHRYLLRNDSEMGTINTSSPHYGWSGETVKVSSVSTKYTNWFVHDVAGRMHYYNGKWYYWDIKTNSIYGSNIEGTLKTLIVNGTSKDSIKLDGITGNKLYYTIGSTQYSTPLS